MCLICINKLFLSLILNPKQCWTCGGKTWQAPIKPSSQPLTSWPDPTWYLLCFQFQQQWIYNVYYTYICIHMYICISGWVEWELASTVSWLLSTTEPSWRLTWLDKRSCQVSSKQPIQTKCWAVKITLEVELRFRVLAFWHPDFNCSILANLEMVILSFALTVLISLHLPSLSKASGSEDSFVTLTIPWQPRLMMIEYEKGGNRAKR